MVAWFLVVILSYATWYVQQQGVDDPLRNPHHATMRPPMEVLEGLQTKISH